MGESQLFGLQWSSMVFNKKRLPEFNVQLRLVVAMTLQGRRSPDMHKTSRRIRLAKRGLGPRWCRDQRRLDSRLTVDWTRWRLGFDSLASFACSARCSTSPSAAGKRPQRNSFALAANRGLTPNSPYAKTILLSQLCTV